MERKKKERDMYKYKTLKEDKTKTTKKILFILCILSFKTQIFPKKPKNGGIPPKDINRYTNSALDILLDLLSS